MALAARFARTVYQARQVVAHRHIQVNGKIVKSPSYQVKPGDNRHLGMIVTEVGYR